MDTYQTMRAIIVPVEKAVTASADIPLEDAITLVTILCCGPKGNDCTRAGCQAILVMDEHQHVLGMVDFQCVIRVLVSEVAASSMPDRVHALWDALGQVSRTAPVDDAKFGLAARLLKNARRPISDVIVKIRKTISPEADLLEALMALAENSASVLPVYDGDRLVGIVRDLDLFARIADIAQSLNKSEVNLYGHPLKHAPERAMGTRRLETKLGT